MKKSAFLFPIVLLAAGCTSTVHIDGGVIDLDSPAPKAAAMPKAAGFRARRSMNMLATSRAVGMRSADFQAPAGRKMSYSTRLVINLPNTKEGIKKASFITKKYNGYITYSDNDVANVKIPVAKAADALKEFEAIGTVASKTITANDVTEHYTDTQVRLENLRRLQKRLSDLLSQTVKVDEILRIEKELSRVTTDLERQQARMNILSKQVEMVDFNISFKAVIKPADIPRSITPVAWVRNFGVGIRTEKFNSSGKFADQPASFELPGGFAITHSTKHAFFAANADSVGMALMPFDNMPGADLTYYQILIEKQLKYVGYTGISVKRSRTASGVEYLYVTAFSGRNSFAAMVAIYRDGWIFKDEKVSVLQLYGPVEAMKKIDLDKFYRSFEF